MSALTLAVSMLGLVPTVGAQGPVIPTGTLAVAEAQIAPGASTQVTATFEFAGGPGVVVSLKVEKSTGATGDVTFGLGSESGATKACTLLEQDTRVDCLWVTPDGPTGTVTVTATASADAEGQFNVVSTATGAFTPGSPAITEESVAGPAALVVESPPPSTTTTTTTSTTTTTTTAPGSSTSTTEGTAGARSTGAGVTPAKISIAG